MGMPWRKYLDVSTRERLGAEEIRRFLRELAEHFATWMEMRTDLPLRVRVVLYVEKKDKDERSTVLGRTYRYARLTQFFRGELNASDVQNP